MTTHKKDDQKHIVVRFSVDLVIEAPAKWTKENADFRFNDGTWCADNLVDMMQETIDRMHGNCLCNFTTAEMLRDATDEDKKAQHV